MVPTVRVNVHGFQSSGNCGSTIYTDFAATGTSPLDPIFFKPFQALAPHALSKHLRRRPALVAQASRSADEFDSAFRELAWLTDLEARQAETRSSGSLRPV